MFGVIEADQHPVEGAAKLAIASSCRSMDALRSPLPAPTTICFATSQSSSLPAPGFQPLVGNTTNSMWSFPLSIESVGVAFVLETNPPPSRRQRARSKERDAIRLDGTSSK